MNKWKNIANLQKAFLRLAWKAHCQRMPHHPDAWKARWRVLLTGWASWGQWRHASEDVQSFLQWLHSGTFSFVLTGTHSGPPGCEFVSEAAGFPLYKPSLCKLIKILKSELHYLQHKKLHKITSWVNCWLYYLPLYTNKCVMQLTLMFRNIYLHIECLLHWLDSNMASKTGKN